MSSDTKTIQDLREALEASKREIPKWALRWYARGVEHCQRLGAPLGSLHVYAFRWCFSHSEWWLWCDRPFEPRTNRIGVWIVFETLDEAKFYGFKRRATKLGPFRYIPF